MATFREKMVQLFAHKSKTMGRKVRQRELADLLGVERGTVSNWVSGQNDTKDQDKLRAIASWAGVSYHWLALDQGDMIVEGSQYGEVNSDSAVANHDRPIRYMGRENIEGERLPIKAAADIGGGKMLLVDEVLETVDRPSVLDGREDGYGIYVSTNAFAPTFRAGNKVFVDPKRPPAENRNVVALKLQKEEAGGNEIYIGELVKITATSWTIWQSRPERTIELERSEWDCLSIVGGDFR